MQFLTDRWLDDSYFPDALPEDRLFVAWAQNWADNNPLHLAQENYFCVRHPDGRHGLLLEIELDDGSEATPEGVEKVRADVLAGEFAYHSPGTEETWNGRAVYRVFFPSDNLDAVAIEAAAKAIFDHVY